MMNADVNWQVSNDRRTRYLRASSEWRRARDTGLDERLGDVPVSRSWRAR